MGHSKTMEIETMNTKETTENNNKENEYKCNSKEMLSR